MSWKQIPYPPDYRFETRAGADVELLRLGSLTLAIDRATGRGVALDDEATATRFLVAHGAGVTFRLLSREGVWIDGAQCAAQSVTRASDAAVEVVYDRPRQCGVEFPVTLTLRYEMVEPHGRPELHCSYRIEHHGGDLIVERVQFPVLSGLDEFAGEATELVLPFIGGERRPAPTSGGWSDFEYVYPNEAMSWMLVHDGTRGLYLASEDPEFRWTVLRGRVVRKRGPEHLELLLETCPYLRSGEAATSQTFVLSAYAGTWHTAADRYRAWLETWWKPPTMPDAVKELRALVELFFEMPHSDGSVERFEADQLFTYMTRCHAEMGLDIAHVCGYHEGGFDARYPLYQPLERIGGEDGLRAFLARCNAVEGWTTDIYINCRITDVNTDWWGEKGRAWACRGKDGVCTTEFYNGQYFTVACPGVAERRRFWSDAVDRLTRDYGSEGLQVDQPHTTARECWAFEEHGHRTPFDHWGQGYIEQFAEIRRQLTEREPRVWSWGEAASDVFSQYFDFSCCYVRYPDQKVAFGETDPATRDWVHDWRGYGMPEVFRYCCPEAPLLQAPAVVGDDVEALLKRLNIIFLYSAMLYWCSLSTGYDLDRSPQALREHLKRLWDARQDLRDTLIHGRFRDTVGLVARDESVLAKLYVSGPGREPGVTVVAINRGEAECEATLGIRAAVALPDHAGAAWTWREHALAGDLRQEGVGTEAVVRIPANRVAAVHFRPQ